VTKVFGTVDSIHNGDFGITCFGGSEAASTWMARPTKPAFINLRHFQVGAGHTYRLSGEISATSGSAVANTCFGFLPRPNVPLAVQTILGIASDQPFTTLYSVLFMPTTAVTLRCSSTIYWHDNQGPILDNVSVTDTAVPLPAAAWLMLSAGSLGRVARSTYQCATRASNCRLRASNCRRRSTFGSQRVCTNPQNTGTRGSASSSSR